MSEPLDANNYAIIDIEVSENNHKIHDIGALKHDEATLHTASTSELFKFLHNTKYLCGHNIIHHDAKYLFAETSLTMYKCR